MATLKTRAGKILLRGGLPTCECCGQLVIEYDWAGTGQTDLDTSTRGFGENLGYACDNEEIYLLWISGDDVSTDGVERVDVRVDDAKADSLWTSSVNIDCHAWWYEPQGGTGSFVLRATYRGHTKSETISDPGQGSGCASPHIAIVTVYSDELPDGTYHEITVL
jgi:hypothetical protein